MESSKNTNINSIAFFFPSYKIGGVEMMYSRIAKILISRGYNIEVIDFDNGTMHNLMSDLDGTFKKVTYIPNHVLKLDAKVCVSSLLHLPYSKTIFPKNVKLLFWDDHPNNLILFLRFNRLMRIFNDSFYQFFVKIFFSDKYKFLKNCIQNSINYKGIVFMCLHNYKINSKFFDLNFTPQYLPIPISIKSIRQFKPIDKNIHCSYVGRLDADKHELCTELMHEVIKYNKNNNSHQLKLHIIGDGNKMDSIKDITIKFPDYFKLCGIIKGDELDNYLSQNIDIAFAVGTSALESAGLGIPTLFMRSLTLQKKFKNQYLWVYDNLNYNLSIENTIENKKLSNFKQAIKSLTVQRNEISDKCYDYVDNTHNINVVIEKLIYYINNTQFQVENL